MIEFGNRTSKMRRAINSLKRKSDREQPFWRGTGLEKKMDELNPHELKKTKATDAKRALLKKRKKRYEQWGSSRTAKKIGLEALDEVMELGQFSKALGIQRMRTKVVDGKKRFTHWNEDYEIAKRKFIKARDEKRAKRAK
jgi:hypothetical protein